MCLFVVAVIVMLKRCMLCGVESRGGGGGVRGMLLAFLYVVGLVAHQLYFFHVLPSSAMPRSFTYIPYGTTRTGEEKEKKGNRFDLSDRKSVV